jgi:hypothetical protein
MCAPLSLCALVLKQRCKPFEAYCCSIGCTLIIQGVFMAPQGHFLWPRKAIFLWPRKAIFCGPARPFLWLRPFYFMASSFFLCPRPFFLCLRPYFMALSLFFMALYLFFMALSLFFMPSSLFYGPDWLFARKAIYGPARPFMAPQGHYGSAAIRFSTIMASKNAFF